MKKIPKWKKAVFLCAAVLILLRIFYICVGGKVDKKYEISAPIDTSSTVEAACVNLTERFSSERNRLNSLELIFTGIADDKTGYITLQITSEDELIYQTNLALGGINNNAWKKIYVNAELKPGKEYEIHLSASENCTQIPNVLLVSRDQAAPETTASYMDKYRTAGEIAVRYGYLTEPDGLDLAVISSLWLILLGIVSAFLYYFEAIKRAFDKFMEFIFSAINREILYAIAEVLGSLVIINSSGITFQPPTRIIFYLISIMSALKLDEKREFVHGLCCTAARKCVLYALYGYAAFSLTGQRMLIYPLNLKITTAGLSVFIITILWFVPVIQTLLCLFERLKVVSFCNNRKLSTLSFVWLVLLFLLAPAIFHLFANNPGISSNDTYVCMITNAHRLHGMEDWHPAFYCMVLRVILTVWDSTYAVILVQYFFWTYVMIELLLYLRKKGIRDSILLGTALFSGANAGNFVHLNTVWKDIPYSLSVFWTLVLLAKLSIDFEEYKKKRYIYVEMAVALVGVFFYRKNGVVTFLVIAVMMGGVLRRNIKVWCALAIACSVIFVVKGPVYSYFEIEDTGRRGMYIGLSQDILGVYYSGGEVSEDTLQMINVMTAYNNAEYSYTPTWSYQSYDLDVEPVKFIYNYMDTFIKNPILMIRAVINREDAVWDIYAGQDSYLGCVNHCGTVDGIDEWNDYYPAREYRSLYPIMSVATSYTANSQWISSIEWRCGLFTLLGLAAVIFMSFSRGMGKYMLITAPIIGHILSLLLSTGWSDFRYFWPLNLMNMGVLLLMLVIISDPSAGPQRRGHGRKR